MTAKDVSMLLDAEVLVGTDELGREVTSACASDMMSEVLAFSRDHSVLITGLCNQQVVRTAEMLDMVCIIYVRGKTPDETILKMAEDRDLIVMCTHHRMFSTCGILYGAGLGSGD